MQLISTLDGTWDVDEAQKKPSHDELVSRAVSIKRGASEIPRKASEIHSGSWYLGYLSPAEYERILKESAACDCCVKQRCQRKRFNSKSNSKVQNVSPFPQIA